MTVFFVDTENIGLDWVSYLNNADKNSLFLLFYTGKSAKISFDALESVLKSPVKFGFIECCTGPNALDFQLVSELGYRIAKNQNHSYVVISRDTGFDVAIKYLRDKGAAVKRISPPPHQVLAEQAYQNKVPDLPSPSPKVSGDPNKAILQEYRMRLGGYGVGGTEVNVVAKILMQAMLEEPKQRRNCAYKAIRKKYGNNRGLELYKSLKKPIKAIVESGPYPVKEG